MLMIVIGAALWTDVFGLRGAVGQEKPLVTRNLKDVPTLTRPHTWAEKRGRG